jgi:D-alanine-D-alanine ligase
MKIVVLAGGLSPERDVSLSSGCLISNALLESGHSVLLLDVYEGSPVNCGVPAPSAGFSFHTRADGCHYAYAVPSTEPDLDAIRVRNGNRKELIGAGVLEACRSADVVFVGLHGAMGENGQLQAVLDVNGIKYTGSGYAGCLLAMDKDITKRLLIREGILTADWIMFDCAKDDLSRIEREIGLPCVVKPTSCGSSVGVSIVDTEAGLRDALAYAKKYEPVVLIEKKITGREFSVGVLDGQALPPIEIVPKSGFYDYANKYQSGKTEEICPARLAAADTARLQSLAVAVHKTVRLGGYSRVDFILDASGDFWCLEANTLPGMTPTSLLPQEAAVAGIPYVELCDKIVRMALR